MSSRRTKHSRTYDCVAVACGVLVAGVVLPVPVSAGAQLKVIVSGGCHGAYETLLTEVERATGIQITTTSGASVENGPRTTPNQVRNGVAADVVILAREGLGRTDCGKADHRRTRCRCGEIPHRRDRSGPACRNRISAPSSDSNRCCCNRHAVPNTGWSRRAHQMHWVF